MTPSAEVTEVPPSLRPLFEADPEHARGLAIFPLIPVIDGVCQCSKGATCKSPGKHPAITWSDLGAGVQVMPRGEQGAGVATGARSGGLVILDIDAKSGVNGFESLERLEAGAWGPLPETLTVRSPSGGLHLWFRHPGAFQSNAGVIGVGLDIRAEGGYAVLPGSPHKSGGRYAIESALPIAMLPALWADRLPRARAGTIRAQVTAVPVEPSDLRQRLADTVKGRRGAAMACLRRAVTGDRMFKIEGGPGAPDLETVHGVDVHMAQNVLFTLARSVPPDEREDGPTAWFRVPGEAVGNLLASSLAALDQDAQEVSGHPTKWTPEHVAATWDRAVEVVAGEVAKAQAFMRALEAATTIGEAARATDTPLMIQLDRRYAILDDAPDRAPRYTELCAGEALAPLARQVWAGRDRPLEKTTDKGTRPMLPAEMIEIYGRAVSRTALDFTARTPRVEGLTLVRGLEHEPPPPAYDTEAERWLALLDPTGGLLDWLWWAKPERCDATAPALALVGASHVGKSALAEGVAVAAGQARTVPLARAMARFAGALCQGPIVFADEGLPRDSRGHPMTEDFRRLITTTEHTCEVKGSNTDLTVRGGVRVILAANAGERLFAGGNLSSEDVSALTRRLFVIDIRDEARALAAKAAIVGMGAFENDPARLARVARHIRWIQEHRTAVPEIKPRGGSLEPALRRSGDLASAALDAISDAHATGAPWVAADTARGVLWVENATLTRVLGLEGRAGATGPVFRAIRAYIRVESTARKAHPVTGATFAGARQRWVGLSLDLLRGDGITTTEEPTQ